MGTIAEKLAYLKATKEAIKDAIKAKGQTVSDTLPFRSYANKISAIETGSKPTIAVSSSGLITATSGNFSNTKQLTTQGAQTITPGTSAKTIASGRYLTGTQTIAGDSDLVASNIKKGVDIFGVTGTYFQAVKTGEITSDMVWYTDYDNNGTEQLVVSFPSGQHILGFVLYGTGGTSTGSVGVAVPMYVTWNYNKTQMCGYSFNNIEVFFNTYRNSFEDTSNAFLMIQDRATLNMLSMTNIATVGTSHYMYIDE